MSWVVTQHLFEGEEGYSSWISISRSADGHATVGPRPGVLNVSSADPKENQGDLCIIT